MHGASDCYPALIRQRSDDQASSGTKVLIPIFETRVYLAEDDPLVFEVVSQLLLPLEVKTS